MHAKYEGTFEAYKTLRNVRKIRVMVRSKVINKLLFVYVYKAEQSKINISEFQAKQVSTSTALFDDCESASLNRHNRGSIKPHCDL